MTTTPKPEDSLAKNLREELKKLLDGGQAHATLEAATKDFPLNLRGVVPQGLPYSAWQIVEHIRIAQRDIIDFSRNTDGNYKPRKWPDSYWPTDPTPSSPEVWDAALTQIQEDREAFEALLEAADEAALIAPFSWGDGQTLLREAFLIADHDAYHTGEIIIIRRLLGAWNR